MLCRQRQVPHHGHRQHKHSFCSSSALVARGDQKCSRYTFAEAAARSAPMDAEAGADNAATQAPSIAPGSTAPAPAQPSAAKDLASGGAAAVRDGAVSAASTQLDMQPPAEFVDGDRGGSTSSALAQANEELRPDGRAAATRPALPYGEEAGLASLAAPAAEDPAGAAARTAPASPAAAAVPMASGEVEVTMSMWQVYCDAAQDLLAPGAPALRGRSMEGLRRVRVRSANDVEVPCLRCMKDTLFSIPCMQSNWKHLAWSSCLRVCKPRFADSLHAHATGGDGAGPAQPHHIGHAAECVQQPLARRRHAARAPAPPASGRERGNLGGKAASDGPSRSASSPLPHDLHHTGLRLAPNWSYVLVSRTALIPVF